MSVLTALITGAAIGFRHSLEPDHIAAVSALTEEEDRNSALVGASWSMGHSAVILFAGFLLLITGVGIPDQIATASEGLAGLILMYLGVRTLLKLTDLIDLKEHSHNNNSPTSSPNTDSHKHPHIELGPLKIGTDHTHIHGSSFLVGVVHGLAGSGSLVLLLVASTTSLLSGLGYLIAFCVATVGAMSLLSYVWGGALKLGFDRVLRGGAGAVSIVAGVLLVIEAVPVF